MSTENVFQPKQRRSQDTQRKLMNALSFFLKDKFFEHISIKDLAEHAGVSVGTFYRRFKDKESLLPLLYQDFGNDFVKWIDDLDERKYDSLEHAISVMSYELYLFLKDKKSVFRTLHLNSRLHSEILESDKAVDRKVIYRRMSNIFLRFSDDVTHEDKSRAADIAIYMMITSLLDKVLYPQLTPAISCDLDVIEFTKEVPQVLVAYLSR